MVTTAGAKLAEDQFISRLRGNIIATSRSAAVRVSDCVTQLRKLTDNTLLRRELEAQYPLGRSVSVRIGGESGIFGRPSQQVMLTGRVVLRLQRLVEENKDDEPMSLAELHATLSEASDVAARTRCESVLGLFSPTGWAEEAKQFLRNEPPGSGWAASSVHPILIGPEITELTWDTKDARLREFVQYFCGLTVEERRRICRDEIQKAIVVQDFANLEKIAETKGFDIDFVKSVAQDLCSNMKELKLATVAGVGPVVKRTI